jgi:hypothetical protein
VSLFINFENNGDFYKVSINILKKSLLVEIATESYIQGAKRHGVTLSAPTNGETHDDTTSVHTVAIGGKGGKATVTNANEYFMPLKAVNGGNGGNGGLNSTKSDDSSAQDGGGVSVKYYQFPSLNNYKEFTREGGKATYTDKVAYKAGGGGGGASIASISSLEGGSNGDDGDSENGGSYDSVAYPRQYYGVGGGGGGARAIGIGTDYQGAGGSGADGFVAIYF